MLDQLDARSSGDALAGFKLYRYNPSMAAAVIFALAFSITTLLHGYQMFRTRTWFFIPFFIGVLLLVAPALFAAPIYMKLGRIVLVVDGERHLFMRTWITKIFVAGDVLSFLMQSSGGGLLSSGNESSIQTDQNVIIGGLITQLIFFGAFIVVSLLFHNRMLKTGAPTQRAQTMPWQKHIVALYIGSLLILVRSIFRVVEYLQGWQGYILSHEIFLYIFDACLMFAVMLIFNWIHPSEIRSGIKGGSYMKGLEMIRYPFTDFV